MRFENSQALRDVIFFIAILATAIALGGALAHAFEFFSKMRLTREDYFTVQTIYAGWNRLAYILVFELLGIIALIIIYRQDHSVMWPVVAAFVFLLASQVVFWVWTFPANAATNNWTEQPGNWEQLRQQWEYSHFVGAVFQVLALSALIIGVLRR